MNDKEKEELKFINTALAGYDRELKKHRDMIKAISRDKNMLIQIKNRILKGGEK